MQAEESAEGTARRPRLLMPAAFVTFVLSLSMSGKAMAQEPPLPAGLGGAPTDQTAEPPLPGGLSAEPPLPGGLTSEPPLPGGLNTEPALPGGLSSEPALPDGLSAEPSLPTGLGSAGLVDSSTTQTGDETASNFLGSLATSLPFDLTGFIETRLGGRLDDDPTQKDTSIGEMRLQLQLESDWDWARLGITADLLYDDVPDDHTLKLDSGNGWLDLRQASLLLRPADNADLEVGRQVLTWGTGDLVFINDLFPKDWNAFLIGRQDEYLKAPSDAIKLALFHEVANLDIVYTPRFNSDRFIDGRRLSFFDPVQGRIVGRDFPVSTDTRNRWLREDELALRAYRNLGSWEGAVYAYSGYWKSPGGQDPVTGLATFPRMNAFGASLRGPVAAGIAAVEAGYYDSRDDSNGDNPFINNSEFRFLTSYEQELLPQLIPQLTLGVQYYLEWLQDYDNYRRSLPPGFNPREEKRHVFTTRLTRLALNQNLTLSLFNYYSPSDDDGYLRANANYKLSDQWQLEAGSNLFYGDRRDTFFGQFEDNNNIYAAIRLSF